MKLLTQELKARFESLGQQDKPDAIVVAKFFAPWSEWTWYATEYLPEDDMFFGLVQGFETELGYFSRAELESIRGPMGTKVERDLHWNETTLDVLRQHLV